MHTPLLDMVFPKQCLGCAREGTHLCEDCFSLLSLARQPSILPVHSSLAGLFCATSYEDKLVQRLIHCFKYPPFLRDLAKPLAFSIIAHFSFLNKPVYPAPFHRPQHSTERCGIYPLDAICPVPLHKRRLRWRGYNHAEELANQLGYAWSLPVISDALLRTKHTAPQVDLGKEQRLKNMKNVFRAQNQQAIAGKNILLVDDVYTTGATMEECAKVLKKAGAHKVFGVAVAHD